MEEQLRSETRNMANIFIGLMLVRIYEYFLGEFEYPTLSFISYAVGCMFGRYSLDEEGLVYAGGDFDIDRYKNH